MLNPVMMAVTAGTEEGVAIVRNDEPIPVPDQGQVLVRIIYAGQNPPDVYALDKQRSSAYFDPNFVLGSDLSGIVVESRSKDVPIGARICAWVPGGTSIHGSYAEYVVCDADMTICVPANMSLRLAAALPFSFFTALHGLQVGLGLEMDVMDKSSTPVLVWGAGTACGYYASQILHSAGYEVIAVAGSRSKNQLDSVGINNFFSRDNIDQVVNSITQRWPNLQFALDCHASQESLDACIRCIQPEESENDETKRYHIHALLPTQPSVTMPANLKVTFDLIHTMTGKPLPILSMVQPAHTADRLALDHKVAVQWSQYDKGLLYKSLQQDKIKTLPVTVWNEEKASIKQRLENIKNVLESIAKGTSLPNGKIVHHIQDVQQPIEHLLEGP